MAQFGIYAIETLTSLYLVFQNNHNPIALKTKTTVQLIDIYVAAVKKGQSRKDVEHFFKKEGVSDQQLKEVRKSIANLGLLLEEPKRDWGKFLIDKHRKVKETILLYLSIGSILLLGLSIIGVVNIEGVYLIVPSVSGGVYLYSSKFRKRRIKRRFE